MYVADSGLYYLQSRYYDPELGRFLNTDSVYDTDAGIQGYNLFVYCGNNPINRIDISGTDSEAVLDADLSNDYIKDKENGQSTSNRRISSGHPSNNSQGSNGSTPTSTNSATPKQSGKGTQNPKVRNAIQQGKLAHNKINYGEGVEKEQPVGQGNRVDGIDRPNQIIYELKPNNTRAITRGQMQLIRYTSAACQEYGGTWFGFLVTYNAKGLMWHELAE